MVNNYKDTKSNPHSHTHLLNFGLIAAIINAMTKAILILVSLINHSKGYLYLLTGANEMLTVPSTLRFVNGTSTSAPEYIITLLFDTKLITHTKNKRLPQRAIFQKSTLLMGYLVLAAVCPVVVSVGFPLLFCILS